MGAEGSIHWPADDGLNRRLAARLVQLRTERGWSLDALAKRVGLSRATLSRIERLELSPTAAMLARLCGIYGWPLSRLVTDAEGAPPTLIARSDQPDSIDRSTGLRRRAVSPPAPDLHGMLVEIRLPADSVAALELASGGGLEHHLWLLDGTLTLDLNGQLFRLRSGDCLRFPQSTGTGLQTAGKRGARYVLATMRP